VLVSASRRNNLLKDLQLAMNFTRSEKFAMAKTPSPARGTPALPRIAQIAPNY
jgi:hypothetical protein